MYKGTGINCLSISFAVTSLDKRNSFQRTTTLPGRLLFLM